MDEPKVKSRPSKRRGMLRGLRPALPAAIGAGALTLLFAAVMPFDWVAGIGWNLYLDRISDFFRPPVGNAGRILLAVGLSIAAAIFAGLIALVLAKPAVRGNGAMNKRVAERARKAADNDVEDSVLRRRRRADVHPDAPPRPPINAERDLPVGGLGPIRLPAGDYEMPVEPPPFAASVERPEFAARSEFIVQPETEVDELVLANPMPFDDQAPADAPWLQPVESSGPALPDPNDHSLGAMVARFEAGIARRRRNDGAPFASPGASHTSRTADQDDDAPVDFALEAALSTLQRMTRSAVG